MSEKPKIGLLKDNLSFDAQYSFLRGRKFLDGGEFY
jgi:hypothetical protein